MRQRMNLVCQLGGLLMAAMAMGTMPVAGHAKTSGPNLIVNAGFENNPPPTGIGNHIGWPITPWVLGSSASANVVTVDGGTGYSNNPNFDAEGTAAGVRQNYLDIAGGANTVSQTFTVPTCGSSDTAPRQVDFYGYFTVRDSVSKSGSGYIRILDQTANNAVLAEATITDLKPTDAQGNIVNPSLQTWKKFGSTAMVLPGHQITYTAYFTDNLNFDKAFMAFTDGAACPSTSLALAKQWNGASNGHQASLQATRDNGATVVDSFVSTANGTQGQVQQDATPFIVFADDEIRIVETLTNAGGKTYNATLSCTGDTTVTGPVAGAFTVKVGSVAANTAPIVCTMVNTNTAQSTLRLVKQWIGAVEGDVATITASPGNGASGGAITLASTATSLANGAAGQTQSGTATVVNAGATYAIAEAMSSSSAAVYDQAMVCSNAQQSGQSVTVSAGAQAVCTITNTLAALHIDKQASAPADTNGSTIVGDVGDQITYTFTVSNTGRSALSQIVVTDQMFSAPGAITWTGSLASLAAGTSVSGTAVYTITANDVNSANGLVVNEVTAAATSAGGNTVNSNKATTSTPTQKSSPAVTITKAASVADTNGSTLVGDLGDVITYVFTVTNSGDTPLTGVAVTDPLPNLSGITYDAWPNPAAPGELPKGTSVIARATYSILQSDVVATKVDNQATVAAHPLAGVTPTALSNLVSVPTVAPKPALSIAKSAVVSDSNTSTHLGDIGDQVTYTIVVSNTGNTPLSGVKVVDPLPGLSGLQITWPDMAAPGVLPKGLSATATATYTITAADVQAGVVNNTATANADPQAGVAVPSVNASASVNTYKEATAASPTPVPTLTNWALACLSIMLVLWAAMGVRNYERR